MLETLHSWSAGRVLVMLVLAVIISGVGEAIVSELVESTDAAALPCAFVAAVPFLLAVCAGLYWLFS